MSNPTTITMVPTTPNTKTRTTIMMPAITTMRTTIKAIPITVTPTLTMPATTTGITRTIIAFIPVTSRRTRWT